jgi:hypothetical protein
MGSAEIACSTRKLFMFKAGFEVFIRAIRFLLTDIGLRQSRTVVGYPIFVRRSVVIELYPLPASIDAQKARYASKLSTRFGKLAAIIRHSSFVIPEIP